MIKISSIITLFLIISTSNAVTCPPYNPNVVVLLPHEYMCTLYYRCERNGPVLMECWPPGTHFSPNTLRCEWAAVANCTLSGVPPTTTTIRTTIPTTLPTTTLMTTQRPTTSPGFTIPTAPVQTSTTTIPTTTTTSTTTSTTTTLTTTTLPANPCPEPDDPNTLVFLPNPDSCASYFLCFNGAKIPRDCAEGFFWDVEKNWCNFRNLTSCGLDEDFMSRNWKNEIENERRIECEL